MTAPTSPRRGTAAPGEGRAASPRIEPLDLGRANLAERLRRLWVAAYTVEARWLGVENFPPLSRTARDFRDAGSRFLGAFRGRRLVAAVELEARADGGRLIAGLVVDPREFRRGHASALLAHVLALPRAGPVAVSTGADNAAALALYRRFDFVEVARRRTSIGVEVVDLRLPGEPG